MSMAMYLPNEDVFVAVLSNCDCKSPQDVIEKRAAIAIGKPYEHKAILAGYTAVYENAKGQQRIISMSENQLTSQLGRNPKAKVNEFQKDRFLFTDDPMLTLEFSRNKNNAVILPGLRHIA